MNVCLKYVSPAMRRILRPAVSESHHSSKSLSFREFDNAYIVPFYKWRVSMGGVADENLQVVIDSSNDEWDEAPSPWMSDEPDLQGGTAIYLGLLLRGYGHTFTDDLRKIWFLQTEQCRQLLADGARIVYTTDFNDPFPAYARDILRYAGFDTCSAVHVVQLTRFDKVVLPDNSFFAGPSGRSYTDEFILNFNRIIDALQLLPASIPDYKKIFLSRREFSSKLRRKKEQGAEEIEQEMKKRGYVVIYPEQYSLAEQFSLYQNCTHFAATEGSVAHNSIFCKPGTDVTIFCTARYLNFHQVAINQFADLNVTYVEACHSEKADSENQWWGPFYFCVTHHFERYLHHLVPHVPFFARRSYWRYMRFIPRAMNRVYKLMGMEKRI